MVTKALIFLILFPLAAWAQLPDMAVHGSMEGTPNSQYVDDWIIFGRTTDMTGSPLQGVTVRVDAGIGATSVRSPKTNLQGEFRSEFLLNATVHGHLSVHVVATKSGYHQATETVEVGPAQRTIGVALVLRGLTQSPDELPLETLVGTLAPKLRKYAEKGSGGEADRKREDFIRGCEKLIDHHDAVRAVPLLSKGVDAAPSCVECRLLLALAMFEAESWAGASQQLVEAAKLNDAATSKRPEPALITGVLEAWRGQTSVSAGFFQKALEIDPNNVLALQEMGRVLIVQKNWAAADQYLQRAIRGGGSDEARLMRIRALLEEDIDEAGSEMDQYIASCNGKSLPPEARTLSSQLRERELRRLTKVISVLGESPQDLIKATPELRGIRWASDQDELEGILEKVGEGVESFFKSLPDTASIERVHQELLGKDGRVTSSLDQDFQYLLLTQPDERGLGIEESRTTLRGTSAGLEGLDKGLMLTEGFAAVPLFFHPDYQKDEGFRYLGRQSLKGQDLYVVAFAQKPQAARSTERFRIRGTSAPVFVQGVAWISPLNFQIVRLHTDLLAPQSEIQLQGQTTDIRFQEVSFKGVAKTFWLPRQVSVMVDWKGRILHNEHRYSDYKLFNVETNEVRKTVVLPASPGQQR